jgi:hypothetical protein
MSHPNQGATCKKSKGVIKKNAVILQTLSGSSPRGFRSSAEFYRQKQTANIATELTLSNSLSYRCNNN